MAVVEVLGVGVSVEVEVLGAVEVDAVGAGMHVFWRCWNRAIRAPKVR